MLISFSGIDSAGKSTQINNIVQYLHKKNVNAKVVWSRGGYTPNFLLIKKIIRKYFGKRLPVSGESHQRDEMFKKKWISSIWLYIALIDTFYLYVIKFRILSALGYVIIADRYIWDTYIDFILKFNSKVFEKKLIWKSLVLFFLKPKYSFLLHIPVEESIRRGKLKKEPFTEDSNTKEKRYAMYLELMENNTWDISINGMASESSIFKKIEICIGASI